MYVIKFGPGCYMARNNRTTDSIEKARTFLKPGHARNAIREWVNQRHRLYDGEQEIEIVELRIEERQCTVVVVGEWDERILAWRIKDAPL